MGSFGFDCALEQAGVMNVGENIVVLRQTGPGKLHTCSLSVSQKEEKLRYESKIEAHNKHNIHV